MTFSRSFIDAESPPRRLQKDFVAQLVIYFLERVAFAVWLVINTRCPVASKWDARLAIVCVFPVPVDFEQVHYFYYLKLK